MQLPHRLEGRKSYRRVTNFKRPFNQRDGLDFTGWVGSQWAEFEEGVPVQGVSMSQGGEVAWRQADQQGALEQPVIQQANTAGA